MNAADEGTRATGLPEWWPSDKPYIIGDCLEGMKAIPDKSVDLVLTDPPYGINFSPHLKKWNGSRNNFERITNDKGEINYKDIIYQFNRISKRMIIFGAENFYQSLPSRGSWICWDKRPAHIENEMIGTPFELAWVDIDGMAYRMYRVLHGGVINADSAEGNNEKRLHPTQKPITLFKKILMDFSNIGDVILDPFLGSGTTLAACRKTNRIGLGFEIEPAYEDAIIKRSLQDIPRLETFEVK